MKQFKLTILLTVLMSMVGARAMADEFTVDGISYYNYDGDEVVLTSGSSCSGDVVIPETVTYNDVTYRVLCIGPGAFSNCSGLTSITIPNSVTAIANEAFYNCDALTSITIPNSVQTIDYSAFAYCSGLTSVNIGNGVEYIEHSAFSFCSNLTSITIPNSVVFIGNYAFQGCENLSSLSVGSSVTTIGAHAFENCGNLSSIIIPNSVTSIGSAPFDYCYDLSSIVVEAGNTAYDSRNNCNAIIEKSSNKLIQGCVNTIIPNSVTSIGDYAFSGIYLESITIPNGVTSIGDGAFSDSGLTSILIPNSVTSIGMEAFYSTEWYWNQSDGLIYAGKVAYGYKGTMPANTNIVLEEGTLGIAGKAFYHCNNLTSISIPNSVKSIGDYAFSWCTSLTSITIPNSVTTIGEHTFGDCSSLTSVTIPNSVTTIGEYTFVGCNKLQKVIVPDIATWCGISFSNYFSNPLYYAHHIYSDENTEITNLVIPNSVTNIEESAFLGCSGLTSITIPNSVTSIGNYAFYGCSSLTLITIPNSVTSIGISAFSGCSGLTSITIPESVTSIGYAAFSGCSGLTSVTVEWTEPIAINYTFSNSANATLYVPYGSKAAYQAANYWKQFKEIVELPDGKLFFEGTTVRCGSQSAIPVLFESEAAYGGLQCEVTLPAGITLNKVSKTARLSDAFTLTKSLTGDNTYQILLYNTERATFAGNDGALFTMTVDVADNMAVGNYDVMLSNIVVSDVDNNQTDLRDCTAVLRVENYLLGDANRDNRVNVTDIMAVANKILKYDVPNFNEHAADVNFDNRINVTDIMGIANIILKINTAAHAPAVQLPEPQ